MLALPTFMWFMQFTSVTARLMALRTRFLLVWKLWFRTVTLRFRTVVLMVVETPVV